MWIVYAVLSSFFAGITAILAKCGIKNTDSNIATAMRTSVVLFFSWLLVLFTGVFTEIKSINLQTFIFLILSGLATGASWLCYFRALQLGNVNKVVSIVKSSTVLTIILAVIFLHETFTLTKGLAIILISLGTMLMITKTTDNIPKANQNQWLIYALLSALFASATTILGKIGIREIDSNLGTAIRTSVVFIMAWLMVFVTKKEGEIKRFEKNEFVFIMSSGLATGISWLCYYKALQDGLTSVVVSIDKLSIIVTLVFSRIVFKERFSKKMLLGTVCILFGTLLLIV